jgi:hypothetical protein
MLEWIDMEVATVVSRVTLFSLLLGLMLAMGISRWSGELKDDCSRFLAGDKSAPRSELVVSGTRTVEVSCNDWTMRQPLRVQVLCLLDIVVFLVFVTNALFDARDHFAVRRRRRPMH